MPRYRHPRVPPDADGDPGFSVSLAGETLALDSDGCFKTDAETAVERLAAAYDTTADALRVDDTCDVVKSDGEVCGRTLPCPYHSD
jgi:hypothetical protein